MDQLVNSLCDHAGISSLADLDPLGVYAFSALVRNDLITERAIKGLAKHFTIKRESINIDGNHDFTNGNDIHRFSDGEDGAVAMKVGTAMKQKIDNHTLKQEDIEMDDRAYVTNGGNRENQKIVIKWQRNEAGGKHYYDADEPMNAVIKYGIHHQMGVEYFQAFSAMLSEIEKKCAANDLFGGEELDRHRAEVLGKGMWETTVSYLKRECSQRFRFGRDSQRLTSLHRLPFTADIWEFDCWNQVWALKNVHPKEDEEDDSEAETDGEAGDGNDEEAVGGGAVRFH